MSGPHVHPSPSPPEPPESRDHVPQELARLLEAAGDGDAEQAWSAFVARYSGLLLRISTTFAPGYDGALDRYTFMLDELRRSDYRRLRTFAADGRGRFSTWLTVVARRLCLDHYRRQHGRFRGAEPDGGRRTLARTVRRGLATLDGGSDDVTRLPAPAPLDPADELDERDRREALRRVLGGLPAHDRLLLELRFEHDLTAREVAVAVGLPTPFHVYRRLEAIYRLVRAQLSGSEDTRGRTPRSTLRANLPPGATGRKYAVAGERD
jgi:RNA polymerase sigma factor (sigma-70 family)